MQTLRKTLPRFWNSSSVAIYGSRNYFHILEPGSIGTALRIFDTSRSDVPPDAIVNIHVIGQQQFELAEIESIAQHVSDLPGHKILIWFCDASPFPVPPREGRLYYPWFAAMTALQRADMGVSPVYCLPAGASFQLALKRDMANFTGGRYYGEYTDLGRAITQGLQDAQSAYSISWNPTDVPRKPIHKIELLCHLRSVSLIYPHAYVEAVVPHKLRARLIAAEAGLATPLSATSIQMSVSIIRDNNSTKAKVSFDTRGIALQDDRGNLVGLLDVIYAYYTRDGHRIPGGQRNMITVGAHAAPDAYTITQSLQIPMGAATLRVLIRDANSGAMGSRTLPL